MIAAVMEIVPSRLGRPRNGGAGILQLCGDPRAKPAGRADYQYNCTLKIRHG